MSRSHLQGHGATRTRWTLGEVPSFVSFSCVQCFEDCISQTLSKAPFFLELQRSMIQSRFRYTLVGGKIPLPVLDFIAFLV